MDLSINPPKDSHPWIKKFRPRITQKGSESACQVKGRHFVCFSFVFRLNITSKQPVCKSSYSNLLGKSHSDRLVCTFFYLLVTQRSTDQWRLQVQSVGWMYGWVEVYIYLNLNNHRFFAHKESSHAHFFTKKRI